MNVRFDVVLEEGDSGYWIAHVPSLPGCHSQGKDPGEALEHVRDAIRLSLRTDEPRNVRLAQVQVP